MSEHDEIMSVVERLQAEFEDLAVRGLRAAGGQRLGALRSVREEFERIGADHLAGRIAAVIAAIEADDRRAAAELLRAQTSLRLFERFLTREAALEALTAWIEAASDE